MALNFCSSCLCRPNTKITGMCHHVPSLAYVMHSHNYVPLDPLESLLVTNHVERDGQRGTDTPYPHAETLRANKPPVTVPDILFQPSPSCLLAQS